MKYVKCINNGQAGSVPPTNNLSVGKVYKVMDSNYSDWTVTDDNNITQGYMKKRFIDVTNEIILKDLEEQLVTASNEISSLQLKVNELKLEKTKINNLIKKEKAVEVGTYWQHNTEIYVLARVTPNNYCLVSLDGVRWMDATNDINDVFGSKFDSFTKIVKPKFL